MKKLAIACVLAGTLPTFSYANNAKAHPSFINYFNKDVGDLYLEGDETWRKGNGYIDNYPYFYLKNEKHNRDFLDDFPGELKKYNPNFLSLSKNHLPGYYWQCATFVQSVTNLGQTSTWKPLYDSGYDSYTQFKKGDVIAIFKKDRQGKLSYNGDHVAIVYQPTKYGAWVIDQNWKHYNSNGSDANGTDFKKGGPIMLHYIKAKGQKGKVTDLSGYSRIRQ